MAGKWFKGGRAVACTVALMLAALVPAAGGEQRASAVIAGAGDWPMYGHDPQRTGYNPDETAMSAANIGELAPAWQLNIGLSDRGRPAFNSPVVAGGRVYVASGVSRGNNLFALDAADGGVLWSANIGSNPEECFGVGIGSTAVVEGNRLVIGGGDAAYYGFNATTGARLWRNELEAGPSGFAWVSPIIANGRAYVGVASDCDNPPTRGEVRALNSATGAPMAARHMVPEGQIGGDIWNSAALSEDETKLYVTTGEDAGGYDGEYTRAILEMDAVTLEVLGYDRQGVPNEDLDWATTPILFHDSQGRQLVGAGQKNGTFYAYEVGKLSEGPVWQWSPGPHAGMLAAYDQNYGSGGIIIVGTRQGIYGLNPADGSGIWMRQSVGEIHGSFALANGLLFVNGDGTLYVIDATTGEIKREITPANNGVTYSGPTVSNGAVYWVSGAYLNVWRMPGASIPAPEPAQPPADDTTYPFYPCSRPHWCQGMV